MTERRVPLHERVERALRDRLDSRDLRPGDLFPSEAALQQEFDVSRSVVRQALASLEADGLIRKVRGRGSVVAEHREVHRDVLSLGPHPAGRWPRRRHHAGRVVRRRDHGPTTSRRSRAIRCCRSSGCGRSAAWSSASSARGCRPMSPTPSAPTTSSTPPSTSSSPSASAGTWPAGTTRCVPSPRPTSLAEGPRRRRGVLAAPARGAQRRRGGSRAGGVLHLAPRRPRRLRRRVGPPVGARP